MAAQTSHQHGRSHWTAPVLFVVIVLGALVALAIAWLNHAEDDYLRGVHRGEPLQVALDIAEAYHTSTGQMPASAGVLLDWLDGEEARFVAGGQMELLAQRRHIGAVRIGVTADGAWCAVVVEDRPQHLSVLAGLPEHMASTAVAGPYAGIDHDTDPSECVSPDVRTAAP